MKIGLTLKHPNIIKTFTYRESETAGIFQVLLEKLDGDLD